MDEKLETALWRYQVIASLTTIAGERGALKTNLETLSQRTWDHPLKGPKMIGAGTIEEWYYRYLKTGLDGLRPQTRSDKGRCRSIDEETAELIERLATEFPLLSARDLIKELAGAGIEHERLPSESSVYRFLRRQGLNDRKSPVRVDRRRFEFEWANQCWQCDVLHGPSLRLTDGRRGKTYLIAFIDDATRVILHGQFYYDEGLRSFKDCLKQALLKRGVPSVLYMDNAKVFRSRLLTLVAARIGINLVHSAPYRPQGRGKIERFFRTVRDSFFARLPIDEIADLEHLNRLLFAFIEGEYHVTVHRGIGERPLDRWTARSEFVKPLAPQIDLEAVFHDRETRRVGKDGTFGLCGRRFEAGPAFIGDKIEVRFDPFDLRTVYVRKDERSEEKPAYPADAAANRRTGRLRTPTAPPKTPSGSLRSLARQAERLDAEERS